MLNKEGITVDIESNYDGSSKGMVMFLLNDSKSLGMEGSALEDFLNWAQSVNLLAKISVMCCDQDASTHKLISDDPRCSHVELVVDPGHKKKSLQKFLMKLFGKKKRYLLFASRIAAWFMRSLSEAKAAHKNDRELIQKEFLTKMSYCIPHYTTLICSRSCPCTTLMPVKVPKEFLLATSESPIAKCSILQKIILNLDAINFNVASLVCRQWGWAVETVMRCLEKKKNKSILTVF